MKVAVLIPLYNHERYITAAVDSLREQTRPPERVIIIDDGSTDGSLAIAQTMARGTPWIEVLSQSNAGAPETINRAVALAGDCDYLAILNSDDCYHPGRIEASLAYLEQHPDVDLCCSRLRLIDEFGEPLSPDTPRAQWFSAAWSYRAPTADEGDATDLPAWLGFANFPGTTSNFFARADYLRQRPFSAHCFAHDYHALILAALEGRLGIIEETLLDYRVHAANTISTAPERLIREVLHVHVDLARTLAPRLPADPQLRARYSRYQRAAWDNISAFRADLFQVLLVEALALLPSDAVALMLAGFDTNRYPEIAEFPNKAIVNTHSPDLPVLGADSGLADKFYALKAQLSSVRGTARQWAEYRQMQTILLGSRWFALGRLLGATRAITRAGGKTGSDKLAIVRERLAASWWVRMGSRLGIPSARKLRAFGQTGEIS